MHPHNRYIANIRRGFGALSLVLALSAAGQTGTVYTATSTNPVVINDPSTLAPGDSIVFGTNYAAVVVNQGLPSAFVNFLNPVTEGNTGVLVFGPTNTTTTDLDFTGKGLVALAGLALGEDIPSLKGHWTPDGAVYLVTDVRTSSVGVWSQLALTGTNVLADGAVARALHVTGHSDYENGLLNLTIRGANSFSGGTTINSGQVIVEATGGLGSGSVTLRDGGLLSVQGAGVSLGNSVEMRPSSYSQFSGSGIGVSNGGTVTGTVRVFGSDTGASAAGYDVKPQIQIGAGGTFSGALDARGAGLLILQGGGLVTASISLQAGAGYAILVQDGGELRSGLNVTAGNRLIADSSLRLPAPEGAAEGVVTAFQPTVFQDLTFQSGGIFATSGRNAGLGIGDAANVYLNGANFDAAYSWGFEGVTDQALLIEGWSSLLGTSQLLMSTESGHIYGTLNAINVLSGYGVQFTLLENSTQLWAMVYETSTAGSAIPEPSTYAALAGVGVLGVAVCRRRGRGARAAVEVESRRVG